MPEPSHAAPAWHRSLLPAATVVVLAAVLLLVLQRATEGLYGYDGYFHIRYAQVLRSQGISRTFPWWQETFLRDHFADKDFLYHVLLIPFTFGDLIRGGKLAAVLFGAAALGVFHIVAHRLRVPRPWAFSLFLLASSAVLLYRLGFTRPLVPAVALALAGTGAILIGSAGWAFAFAAVYPHLHISFHLLPCVALLHDALRGRDAGGRRSFRLTGWTFAGAAAGALLSPYVPNNLYLWWVQNVRVLGMAWGGPDDLRMGVEIGAMRSDALLQHNIGVFAALFAAVFLIARGRRRASPQAITLLVISSGFLALTMLSRRFVEFWAPYTLLLAGVAARDAKDDAGGRTEDRAREESEEPPGPGATTSRRRAAGAAVAACGVLLFTYNVTSAWRFIGDDPGPTYAGASEWMRANIPPGETIFHLDWDDFPQLFFFNPQFHYLLGLDPTFMYLTDPARWRLWSDVAHTNVEDIYTPIRKTFGCRWVFAIPEGEDFIFVARRDPRFFPRYEDAAATVFFLAEGFTFVDHWRVTGWYPDPLRRLFDVALGPEPPAPGPEPPGPPAAPEAQGPGSAGLDLSTSSGFVDLAGFLRMPLTATEACAVAESTLVARGPERVTLALTTDDEFRVTLNGREAISYSPYRTPPPGAPGGVPATLDEFLQARSHVPERSVQVDLVGGANPIVVKVCRAGSDFGFFLRAYRADGSPVEHDARPSGHGSRGGQPS